VLPAEVVEEITTSRRARKAQAAPATRMVYEQAAPQREPRQVPWGLVVVLVIAVAGAAAYHGYRYVNRPTQASLQIPGAPTGTVGALTPQGKVLVTPAGVKLDPKEVENFKNLERAKGNEVREISPGTFIVSSGGPRPKAPAGPGGEPTQGAKP
jgi:hypothetical protein